MHMKQSLAEVRLHICCASSASNKDNSGIQYSSWILNSQVSIIFLFQLIKICPSSRKTCHGCLLLCSFHQKHKWEKFVSAIHYMTKLLHSILHLLSGTRIIISHKNWIIIWCNYRSSLFSFVSAAIICFCPRLELKLWNERSNLLCEWERHLVVKAIVTVSTPWCTWVFVWGLTGNVQYLRFPIHYILQ